MISRRAIMMALLLPCCIANVAAEDNTAPSPEDLWPAMVVTQTAAAASPSADAGTPVAGASGSESSARKRTLTRPASASRARSADNAAAPTTQGTSGWLKTTLSLAGVISLIVLLAWGYKKATGSGAVLPFAFRGRSPGVIEIIGRTILSPKQSLCLVRVGPRLVLLGLGADGVRTLDVIDRPETVAQMLGEAQAKRPSSRTAEFSACLEDEEKSYDAPPPPSKPRGPALAPQPLLDAIQRLGQLSAPAK